MIKLLYLPEEFCSLTRSRVINKQRVIYLVDNKHVNLCVFPQLADPSFWVTFSWLTRRPKDGVSCRNVYLDWFNTAYHPIRGPVSDRSISDVPYPRTSCLFHQSIGTTRRCFSTFIASLAFVPRRRRFVFRLVNFLHFVARVLCCSDFHFRSLLRWPKAFRLSRPGEGQVPFSGERRFRLPHTS